MGFFRRAVHVCYKLPHGLIHVSDKETSSLTHSRWASGLHDLDPLLILMLANHTPSVDNERERFSQMLLSWDLAVPGALIRLPPAGIRMS